MTNWRSSKEGVYHCLHCKRDGHVIEFCWDLNGKSELGGNVETVTISKEKYAELQKYQEETVTISKEEYAKVRKYHECKDRSPSVVSCSLGESTMSVVSSTSVPWIIDSGATDHVSGISSLFTNIEAVKSSAKITVANGSTVSISGVGPVSLTASLTLPSTLYIPNFPMNLLSVSKLTKQLKCSVVFEPNFVSFQDLNTGKVIGKGREVRGLYYFDHIPVSPTVCQTSATPLQVHSRLGHPSLVSLKKLVPSLSKLSNLECESCQLGKHHRVSYKPRINKRVDTRFGLVHSDVWGPSRVNSRLGYCYFVLFVDDYSRMTWVYLMKSRSEMFSIFASFCSEVKTQHDTSIKILRSDNAKEYFSTEFNEYMRKE